MGLIKAASGAAGGVLADQWREYFYCDALPGDVLVAKGQKRTSGRSSKHERGSGHHLQRLHRRRERGPVHDDRRAGRHRRILRGSRRVRLGQLHGADHALRRLWRRAQGLVGPLQKALHDGRRHRQGPTRVFLQHQGDPRQQIRHAQPRPVPRRGPEHRARHRHLDPLFRRIFLSAERPDAVSTKTCAATCPTATRAGRSTRSSSPNS